MTASSLHHRPTPLIAAAAAVVAIAAGTVALAVSHDAGSAGQAPASTVTAPPSHHFQLASSGGHLVGD
jgi:hypothetical protein